MTGALPRRDGTSLRAVFFDLDRTLLDTRGTLRIFLAGQVERLPALARVPADRYAERALELDARGDVPRKELFDELSSYFALGPSAASSLNLDFESRFPERCVPFPGGRATFDALRGRRIQLGLITNGSRLIQRRKIERLGIASDLDAIAISGEEGVRKPSPLIFQRALERLGARADESAFVGDHPDHDVRAAKRVGMRAIWRRDPLWAAPEEADATIDELLEIPAIVERW